jgi:hypothetical protein
VSLAWLPDWPPEAPRPALLPEWAGLRFEFGRRLGRLYLDGSTVGFVHYMGDGHYRLQIGDRWAGEAMELADTWDLARAEFPAAKAA